MSNDELMAFLRGRFPQHDWEKHGAAYIGRSDGGLSLRVERAAWGKIYQLEAQEANGWAVGWGRTIEDAIAACSSEAAKIVGGLAQ